MQLVFPVNATTYHEQHGTFATGGGDGVINIWDLDSKTRIKSKYNRCGYGPFYATPSPIGSSIQQAACTNYRHLLQQERFAYGIRSSLRLGKGTYLMFIFVVSRILTLFP